MYIFYTFISTVGEGNVKKASPVLLNIQRLIHGYIASHLIFDNDNMVVKPLTAALTFVYCKRTST